MHRARGGKSASGLISWSSKGIVAIDDSCDSVEPRTSERKRVVHVQACKVRSVGSVAVERDRWRTGALQTLDKKRDLPTSN